MLVLQELSGSAVAPAGPSQDLGVVRSGRAQLEGPLSLQSWKGTVPIKCSVLDWPSTCDTREKLMGDCRGPPDRSEGIRNGNRQGATRSCAAKLLLLSFCSARPTRLPVSDLHRRPKYARPRYRRDELSCIPSQNTDTCTTRLCRVMLIQTFELRVPSRNMRPSSGLTRKR